MKLIIKLNHVAINVAESLQCLKHIGKQFLALVNVKVTLFQVF
jgi:hypothetical protein